LRENKKLVEANRRLQASKQLQKIQIIVLLFFVVVSSVTNYEDTKSFIGFCGFVYVWFAVHLIVAVVGVWLILHESRLRLLIDGGDQDDAAPRVVSNASSVESVSYVSDPLTHSESIDLGLSELSSSTQGNIVDKLKTANPSIDMFQFPKYWLNDGRFSQREVIRVYLPSYDVSVEYRFSPDEKTVYRRVSDDEMSYPESFQKYSVDELKEELTFLGSKVLG
jgi:hypothetical protein